MQSPHDGSRRQSNCCCIGVHLNLKRPTYTRNVPLPHDSYIPFRQHRRKRSQRHSMPTRPLPPIVYRPPFSGAHIHASYKPQHRHASSHFMGLSGTLSSLRQPVEAVRSPILPLLFTPPPPPTHIDIQFGSRLMDQWITDEQSWLLEGETKASHAQNTSVLRGENTATAEQKPLRWASCVQDNRDRSPS